MPTNTTNTTETESTTELLTTDAAATPIGSSFTIPSNSTAIVTVRHVATLVSGNGSRTSVVRKAIRNNGGTLTDGTQRQLVTTEDSGATSMGSAGVSVTRTTSTGRVEVTGLAANVRHRVDVNVLIVSSAANTGSAPSTLTLSMFCDDFSAGDLPGNSSAGSSAGRDLDVSANKPSSGAAFGSHTSGDFDGVNDFLDSQDVSFDTILPAGAGAVEVVCELDSLGSDTTIYDQRLIFGDTGGNFCIVSGASGVRFGYYEAGVGFKTTGYVTVSTATKLCIQAKYDGTTAKVRVNGGSWQTVSAGNVMDLSSQYVRVGKNYASAAFMDGRIARVLCWASAPADSVLDDSLLNAQSDYGVP